MVAVNLSAFTVSMLHTCSNFFSTLIIPLMTVAATLPPQSSAQHRVVLTSIPASSQSHLTFLIHLCQLVCPNHPYDHNTSLVLQNWNARVAAFFFFLVNGIWHTGWSLTPTSTVQWISGTRLKFESWKVRNHTHNQCISKPFLLLSQRYLNPEIWL